MGTCLITPNAARVYRMPNVPFPDEAPEESTCTSPGTSTSNGEESQGESDGVERFPRSESSGSSGSSGGSGYRGSRRHRGAKKKFRHNSTLTFKLRLPPSTSSGSLPSLPGTVTSSTSSTDRASTRNVRLESIPLTHRSGGGCVLEELEEMTSEPVNLSGHHAPQVLDVPRGSSTQIPRRLPSDPRVLSAQLPRSWG